jgi:uncharacterized protein (TIGR00661 family)
MSKILFIIKNEGRGHWTQALALKSILEENKHNIIGVLVGNSKLRTLPPYYNKISSTEPILFDSPNFIIDKKDKSIKIWKSIIYNLLIFYKFIFSIKKIHKEITKLNPAIIINFNDPLIFLYQLIYHPKIPVYMISHSLMYIHPQYKFPAKNNYFKRLVMRYFTLLTSIGASKKIALSFYTYPDVPKRKLYVSPPLLRQELFNIQNDKKDFILIYLLNKGYKEDIINWHNKNKNIELHCFYDEINAPEEYIYDSTLTFHKINDIKFLKYMKSCKALVTTAGFETVCEALYLSKPILMFPVKGQFEQFFNANDALKINAGMINKNLSDLTKFIEYINNYQFTNMQFINWVNSSKLFFLNLFPININNHKD